MCGAILIHKLVEYEHTAATFDVRLHKIKALFTNTIRNLNIFLFIYKNLDERQINILMVFVREQETAALTHQNLLMSAISFRISVLPGLK